MFYLLFYNNRNIITFIFLMTISIFNLLSYKAKYDTRKYNFLPFFILPIFSSINDQINISKDYFRRIYSLTSYKQKLMELESNLIQKQITTQEKDFLIEENLKLKKELLYYEFLNSKLPYPAISAKVIYRTINYPHSLLILNRGLVDSIETGMPVIKFQFIEGNNTKILENIAIGRIGEVNQYFSQLIPITNINSKIYAKITNTSYTGFVTGMSYENNLLSLDYLDKLLPISKEEEKNLEVVTSSESIFPEGIKIGKVINILTIENNVKQFIIHPYFNFSNLDYVFILRKNLNFYLKNIIEKIKKPSN